MQNETNNRLCFCGHDCARCKNYLATVCGDESLLRESQQFYKREFGLDIPLSELCCNGCRSELTMRLCRDCPWVRCAKGRGLNACADCGEYPCKPLAEYQAKYVNKCNQI